MRQLATFLVALLFFLAGGSFVAFAWAGDGRFLRSGIALILLAACWGLAVAVVRKIKADKDDTTDKGDMR